MNNQDFCIHHCIRGAVYLGKHLLMHVAYTFLTTSLLFLSPLSLVAHIIYTVLNNLTLLRSSLHFFKILNIFLSFQRHKMFEVLVLGLICSTKNVCVRFFLTRTSVNVCVNIKTEAGIMRKVSLLLPICDYTQFTAIHIEA